MTFDGIDYETIWDGSVTGALGGQLRIPAETRQACPPVVPIRSEGDRAACVRSLVVEALRGWKTRREITGETGLRVDDVETVLRHLRHHKLIEVQQRWTVENPESFQRYRMRQQQKVAA